MKLINEAQVFEQWAPMLEAETKIKDKSKLTWMSKYCHYHQMNESFTYPAAGLLNTPGMGNVTPAGSTAGGAAGFYGAGSTGSGDKFPSLLPISIQVAGQTLGFDIVSVIPMQGPAHVLTYMDYVYAGGKNPGGAPPYGNPGNPGINEPYREKPLIFKVKTTGTFEIGTNYVINLPVLEIEKAIKVAYVGKSRIDGFSIFRIVGEGTVAVGNGESGPFTLTFTAGAVHSVALVEVIDADTSLISTVDDSTGIMTETEGTGLKKIAGTVSLVNAMEDHIAGYTGAGPKDEGIWSGNGINGKVAYEPMSRGVGEEQYYRTMGLQAFTKWVEAKTIEVASTVTTEQIQDMSRQYGIDILSMMENAMVNDLSQAINKHILSRAFALGWQNHFDAHEVEGLNLNMCIETLADEQALTDLNALHTGYIGKEGTAITWPKPIPAQREYGGFENQDTKHSRIFANVLAAGNLVHQRGRRGPANFVVSNLQVATALQKNAQYSFAPMANTINQNNGSLYSLGTIAGMTIYVDPNMGWNDNRVLVGRKGADEEPGLKFMPYMMAESISTIAEGTMAPKMVVKSRYALVEAGHHPQTQYITLIVGGNVL